MKTRPILFSGSMVLAILDGTKTQTRRVIKPQPSKELNFIGRIAESTIKSDIGKYSFADRYPCARQVQRIACPYGKPGDTLWVKETSRLFDDGEDTFIQYRADMEMLELPSDWYSDDPVLARWIAAQSAKPKMWRPSILMPQRASRITLQIESVRVERLQDISENDCAAEGIPQTVLDTNLGREGLTMAYRQLWESINGPESWDANPFVWVITFKRIKP